MNALEELAESFSRLPGIGVKSAGRLVNHILKSDKAWVTRFAKQIETLQDKIKECSVCGSWTENDPCPICADLTRDRTIICVVEQARDVSTINDSGVYRGLFHVLGGVISPLEGIGPNQLRIASLVERVKDGSVKEVIIATNPTVEGDTTALYIQRLLSTLDIKVTRLASGLPVGGELEYVDRQTLMHSLNGRVTL